VLRKRYKKFRYTLGWKYPWLYRKLSKAMFPTQVLVLCVSLLAVVSFYKKHYSFEATMRASEQTYTTDYIHPLSPANTPASSKVSAVNREVPAVITNTREVNPQPSVTQPAVVPVSLTRDNNISTVVVKTEIQKSDDALLAEVLKAEAYLQQKKQQTKRLEERVESEWKERDNCCEQLKQIWRSGKKPEHKFSLSNGFSNNPKITSWFR